MKRLLLIILCSFFCTGFFGFGDDEAEKPVIDQCNSDFSAIVIDDNKNRIIYEYEADKIIYPASLTKVMTVYLAFEELKKGNLRLSDKIVASAHAQDISHINKITTLKLQAGDVLTVQDAIRASAIKSMNEASVMLAEKIAGDEWKFAKMMNKKAKSLKMKSSNFRNATGLHEAGQYSTVYDLARLLIAIRKDFPEQCEVFGESKLVCNDKTYFNHNLFLKDYEGATGFKTGYTSIAGYNLMATAQRDGVSITAIVAACDRSENRNNFMAKIIDEGFKVIKEDKKEVKVYLKTSFDES